MEVVKLKPVVKDYIWGGDKLKRLYGRSGGDCIAESWELSVHPDGVSGVGDGTLCEYLAANPHAVDVRGGELPVLIKYIDAKSKLSVQVHPDDAYARAHENDNGKTEMWYIISADNGAGIYCGFKRDTTREEFISRVKSGTVEEMLNFIPVRGGDCFLIKAGTVHAIGAGCVICEVQQSSNVTYRAYDYDRVGADGKPRQLHLEKAAEVINYSAFRDETDSGAATVFGGGEIRRLTECEHFRCRELIVDGEYCEVSVMSFVAINVINGDGDVNGMEFTSGDSFFVPCGISFRIRGKAKIILTDGNAK